MTEQEWEVGPVPALIEHVRTIKSDTHFFRVDMGRKHALCAVALARRYWNLFDAEAREVIDCIEESRPGPNINHLDISTNDEIERMLNRIVRHKPKTPDAYGALWLFWGSWKEFDGTMQYQIPHAKYTEWRPIIRDIFGNPFRPVAFAPGWRTPTAVALAEAMYQSRDFGPMPVLADALEEAGCDHPDVLAHCRGDGPHVRGCWVIDLVLGKS